MFEAETEVVELQSRMGRVGSIQAWNPWESRKSVAHAKWWVSKVASLSYGNEEAKNPDKLFQSIVERGHLSCLEFVPFPTTTCKFSGHLPEESLRHNVWALEGSARTAMETWGKWLPVHWERDSPASAFLVECPLYTRSQWVRHRAFSYLELSRRYTKGSKVEWEYYGDSWDCIDDVGHVEKPGGGYITRGAEEWEFWKVCEAEYLRRLDAGWPNEIARGCMPVEAMTRFWACGFDRDWASFVALRADPHAQEEVRAFAEWIKTYLEGKKASND
jgi:hypothetical protein